MLYFSLLSFFILARAIFLGFLATLAIGGMMLSLKIVIALALLLLIAQPILR